MLKYLRDASEKPVAKILMGLLIFSFVGWGVADYIFGDKQTDDSIITVGGTPVTIARFNNERDRALQRMDRADQKHLYSDKESLLAFNQTVLAGLRDQTMLDNRADYLNFVVTPAAVASVIRGTPQFQTNDKFDPNLYDGFIMKSGIGAAGFEDAVRGQIMRSYVMIGASTPVNVPDFMARAMGNARYAVRKINYAVVKNSDFKVADPTDAQLSEFYARSPIMLPESRTVSYVFVPVSDMGEPDKSDAGLEEIKSIQLDIVAGDAMKSVAEKHHAKFGSETIINAGKIAPDPVLTPAVLKEVFGMESGTETDYIELKDGYAIVRLEKISPAAPAEFRDVRDTIVGQYKNEELKKAAYIEANARLRDFKAGGALRGGKVATVGRTDGAYVDILVAAFSNPVGSKIIVPGTDSFYVLSIESENFPAQTADKMKSLSTESQKMLTRAMTDDYMAFLLRQYPVKINKRNFNRLFGQNQ